MLAQNAAEVRVFQRFDDLLLLYFYAMSVVHDDSRDSIRVSGASGISREPRLLCSFSTKLAFWYSCSFSF